MESFRAIVEKQLARRETSAIRAALGAGLTRDAIRSVLRGRAPSVDRAAEICEALDLEFYIGPRRAPPGTGAESQAVTGLSHIRDRRLAEMLALMVGHWQALDSEYARADFVARLYEREPRLREAARKRRGRRHRFPRRALQAVSQELQALGSEEGAASGIDAGPLLASLRGLGVRSRHPVYDELGRLEGPQSHAVICQAFLRAGVWLDVRIRAPDETGSGTGAVGVLEWRRPNYRVIYSADLVHIGAKLDNEWVVMLAGEVDRLIAEGLVDRAARDRHVPCSGVRPAPLVSELVWAPPEVGSGTREELAP